LNTENFTHRIEISSNIKARIEVAEVVLKTLKIDYEIVPSKPHTSRLMYEKPLTQVHDILALLDNGSKIYAEQIKNDFETRRYWRKQFQKFHKLQKYHS
jgi:hypothetical protein